MSSPSSSPLLPATDRDPFLPTHSPPLYRSPSTNTSTRFSSTVKTTRKKSRKILYFVVPATLILLIIASSSSSSEGVVQEIAQHGKEEGLKLGEKLKGFSWDGVKEGRWGYREPSTSSNDTSPSLFVETVEQAQEEEKEEETIKIDMRPESVTSDDRVEYEERENEKYLGYLPHSGFHNQRAALQNALYLGKLLNRTVLLPPAWIGWPTGLEFYDELQTSWNTQISMHPSTFSLPSSISPNSSLFESSSFPSTSSSYPSYTGLPLSTRLSLLASSRASKALHWAELGYSMRPDGYPLTNLTKEECKSFSPECRGTFRDTWLDWRKVLELGEVERIGVRLRDRWDLREKWIEDELGVKKEDVLVFTDADKYDFQFLDHYTSRSKPSRPLISNSTRDNHFIRTVSIPAMRKLPQKVLLIGSLFGHRRVFSELSSHPNEDPTKLTGSEASEFIAKSMSFSNEYILEPAREIRDLLGGSQGYVGVHARVGDGVFEKNREANMWDAWRRLGEVLGVEENVRDEEEKRIREIIEKEREADGGLRKRELSDEGGSDWSLLDQEVLEEAFICPPPQQARPSIPRSHRHLRRSPPTSSSLSCRSPLHTSTSSLAYNTPLYLATDSRSPLSSSALRPFFLSFPCIHLLSSFEHLPSVKRMKRLVNEVDGVELGRLFVPFLEASIASMGKKVVGTKGSTFSAYAETTLHNAFVPQVDLDNVQI